MIPYFRNKGYLEPPPYSTLFFDFLRDQTDIPINRAQFVQPRPNLVLSPAMNTDSNTDGVVDDFTKVIGSGFTDGVDVAFTVSGGYQVITLTNAPNTSGFNIAQQGVTCAPGEVISVSVVGKKSGGNIRGRFYVSFYNGAAFISNSTINDITAETDTTSSVVNLTAPANTTLAYFRCAVTSNAIGESGSVSYKTALMVKATTASTNADAPQPATRVGALYGPNGAILDGDDYLTIPNYSGADVITLTDAQPLGIWYVANSQYTGTGASVICKNTSGASDRQYQISHDQSNGRMLFRSDDISAGVNSPSGIVSNGVPYFGGMMLNSSTIKGYLNGREVVSGATTGARLTSRPNLRIARRETAAAHFIGTIAFVAITYGAKPVDMYEWFMRNRHMPHFAGISA